MKKRATTPWRKKSSAKKRHRLIDIHTLAEAGYCSPHPRRSNVAPTQDEHGGHDDSGEHGANHPAPSLGIHHLLHLSRVDKPRAEQSVSSLCRRQCRRLRPLLGTYHIYALLSDRRCDQLRKYGRIANCNASQL